MIVGVVVVVFGLLAFQPIGGHLQHQCAAKPRPDGTTVDAGYIGSSCNDIRLITIQYAYKPEEARWQPDRGAIETIDAHDSKLRAEKEWTIRSPLCCD